MDFGPDYETDDSADRMQGLYSSTSCTVCFAVNSRRRDNRGGASNPSFIKTSRVAVQSAESELASLLVYRTVSPTFAKFTAVKPVTSIVLQISLTNRKTYDTFCLKILLSLRLRT